MKIMNVNRSIVKFVDNKQNNYEQPVTLSPSKSISFVWELTEEIYSLSGGFDVKSRLQRNVVNIIRGKS